MDCFETRTAELVKEYLAPDPSELMKDYRCPLGGSGEGYEIVHWEMVSNIHYILDVNGDATNIVDEVEVVSVGCSCGRQRSI